MKALRILALIAVGASCHLDKLLNGGGGRARPPSNGTAVALVFSSLPRAPRAGPLGQVQVSVVDSVGQPVAGVESTTVTVALGANPGGGTLRGKTATRPARGVATFPDLALNRAESGYTLTAAADGLPTVTSDTFTVLPGPASRLTFTVEPRDVSQGDIVTPPVVVTAYDSLDNPAADFTGAVRLALRQNGTIVNGVLSGAGPINAVAGVATFADLRISNVGQAYTLIAAFGSAPPVAESAPFNVKPPGPPPPPTGDLAITTATTTMGANAPSGYTVSVDGHSAGSIGATQSITINGITAGDHMVGLADVPSMCTVTGANPVTVNVPADGTGRGAFVVTCGAPPPPPPPGSGRFLRFTDQPAITQAGHSIRAVRVTVYDEAGNQDRSYAGDATLSLGFNPSGGTLTGGGTFTVTGTGVGQWLSLTIDKPGFGYTLHATAPGVREVFSDPFDITADPPPQPNGADGLGFFQQPTTTLAGEVITPAVRVAALNGSAGGTVVPGFNGPIWISLFTDPNGATLVGTRRVVPVNGFATFSDLRIDKPGTYQLRVSAWPLNSKESVQFVITSGSPTSPVLRARRVPQ